MFKHLLAAGAAAAALALTGQANAAVVYDLTLDGCTGTCGGGPYGTVTATQNGSSWDIVVSLLTGNTFHSTSDPQHHALVFDLVGNPSITVSGLASPFKANGVQTAGSTGASPFGSWDYVINFPKEKHPPAISTFSFNIAPTNPADTLVFDYNTVGQDHVFFATDITGTNGLTGNIGATLHVDPPGVPEPATWAMMILGIGGVGYAMRRRTRAAAAA